VKTGVRRIVLLTLGWEALPTFESWREEDRRIRESDDWGSFA
jgi:hypothetical protein